MGNGQETGHVEFSLRAERTGAQAPLPLLACGQERPLVAGDSYRISNHHPACGGASGRSASAGARLQRYRGGTGALPLVTVKAYGLLRFASTLRVTLTTPVGCSP